MKELLWDRRRALKITTHQQREEEHGVDRVAGTPLDSEIFEKVHQRIGQLRAPSLHSGQAVQADAASPPVVHLADPPAGRELVLLLLSWVHRP